MVVTSRNLGTAHMRLHYADNRFSEHFSLLPDPKA